MDDRKMPPSPADQANRELFLSPDTIGDSEESPLLEQAHKNVMETDYGQEAERDAETRKD